MPARQPELGEPDDHAEGGHRETEATAGVLGDDAGNDRPEEAAGIDAHVEEAEAGIAAGAALRVEAADDRARVRLQHADAHGDDQQARAERRDGRRDAEDQVTDRDEHAAGEDRVALAGQAVGDPAAGQRHQVDAGRVQSIDRRCGAVIQTEAALGHGRDQEQHQQGTHAVIGEAFPHLGHRQHPDATGMSRRRVAGIGDGHGVVVRSRQA